MKFWIEYNDATRFISAGSFSELQTFSGTLFDLAANNMEIHFPLPNGQAEIEISNEKDFKEMLTEIEEW